ncbi:MAG TPA: NUDIX hydrolase [Candidatus Korarchaeota archaeon]|nr:NUDIX hydrolase [Candidatus Korarchaeota archaeon]
MSGDLFSLKPIVVRAVEVRTRSGVRLKPLVDHPGAVVIVPVQKGEVYLIRQWRYAVGEELIEVPAGTLEPGEEPDKTAVRELREEAGLEAGRLIKFYEAYSIPGYGNELMHFYIATDLREVGQRQEEDEEITVLRVSLDEAIRMVEDNRIRDLKTSLALLMAERILRMGLLDVN